LSFQNDFHPNFLLTPSWNFNDFNNYDPGKSIRIVFIKALQIEKTIYTREKVNPIQECKKKFYIKEILPQSN